MDKKDSKRSILHNTTDALRQSISDLQAKLELTREIDLRRILQKELVDLKSSLAGALLDIDEYAEA